MQQKLELKVALCFPGFLISQVKIYLIDDVSVSLTGLFHKLRKYRLTY